jgi:hypothetical protein
MATYHWPGGYRTDRTVYVPRGAASRIDVKCSSCPRAYSWNTCSFHCDTCSQCA